MKGHELEALRRILFFSVTEAALLIGEVSEQAWRRWEAGSRAVPEDVAQRLRALTDWRQVAISAAIRQIAAAPEGARVALIWYENFTDWSEIPAHVVRWRPQQSVVASLAAEFAGRVVLVEFDREDYVTWLAGRPDNEAARARWAAEQP